MKTFKILFGQELCWLVSLDRQVLTALERVEMAPNQVKKPEEGNHLMITLALGGWINLVTQVVATHQDFLWRSSLLLASLR